MPWLSIILAILSFVMMKKKGVSDSAALLTAAAVGVGSYYTIDPAGPTDLFEMGATTTSTGGSPDALNPADTASTSSSFLNTAGQVAGTTVTTTGEVLKSWGPAGTALVATTATGLATDNNWLIYGGLAIAALLLLK